MQPSTSTASIARLGVAIVGLVLAAAVAGIAPRVVLAQDVTLEKYVASVNGAAPATGAISVAEGDSVVYGLAVTGSPDLAGTDVTVTDVFKTNELAFTGASAGGCTEEQAKIVCTLTLDDAGATEVQLTFTVLPVEGATDNCQRLVNNATVQGEGGAETTSQAEIETCPAGATSGSGSEGTLSGTGSGGQGTGGAGGTAGEATNPDTALMAESAPATGATVVLIGLVLVVGALLMAGRHPAVAPVLEGARIWIQRSR